MLPRQLQGSTFCLDVTALSALSQIGQAPFETSVVSSGGLLAFCATK